MEALKVPEHDQHHHSLTLIDLQLDYLHYEEEAEEDVDDSGEDGGLQVVCYRCGEEIHMYHKYYYKCIESACNVSLHKFCGELPTRLEHASHPHTLVLHWMRIKWRCNICLRDHASLEMCYNCSECDFFVDLNCAGKVEKKIIHHPSHPHSLMCLIPKPILYECSACGKEHEGMFYQCTTCVGFTLNNYCAFLPKKLQSTHDAFYHLHLLTISYSFSKMDQISKHNPRCRVCGHGFYDTENLWIYKCDKCMYYAHVDCVTSRREMFLRAGLRKTVKNFEDAHYPHLLHLPFPDETYSVPKLLPLQESERSDEVNLEHKSHQHPLILVNQMQTQTDINGQTSTKTNSWLLMCHDPMKKTQLLCNGCLRPIMSTMPFYECAQHCNFALHQWCTRLPQKVDHPGHPQHTLVLVYPNDLPFFFGVFNCDVCFLPCNGFAYCCLQCTYYVDVTCGFIPKEITHKAHTNHLLSLVPQPPSGRCLMCLKADHRRQLSFSCNVCNIYIHPECALLLSETIRHKYDKHPMHLSYLPIENHKSEYFCEICEFYLNPHESFYHCQHCAQSIHSACAPLILQSETHTYMYNLRSTYLFVNIKFGGIHNTDGHTHPLSFTQGTVSDDQCSMCGGNLQYKMIFKCYKCKQQNFAVDYNCCENLNRALKLLVSDPNA